MASSYPGALDALSDPVGTDPMNSVSVPHATQHKNVNDAIEAIQATLGVNPQGAYASVAARMSALPIGGHTHVIADTTGLQTALDSKATLSSTAAANLGTAAAGSATTAARSDHVHKLPTLVELGAAATVHTHVIADVTSLQTSLDAKVPTTRTVTAGSGLTGGGALSANITVSANLTASGGDAGTAVTVARGDHFHDGRYFTETESDARFATLAHNHNATYAKVVPLATGTALPAVGSYSEGDIVAFY